MPDNTHAMSEVITLRGHIIDSLILPKVMDTVMDLGGDFDVLEINVGRHKNEPSFARLRVFAGDDKHMDRILIALQGFGVQIQDGGDVVAMPALKEGTLPDDFYSTTNLPTQIRLGGQWISVANTEMDLVRAVDRQARSA